MPPSALCPETCLQPAHPVTTATHKTCRRITGEEVFHKSNPEKIDIEVFKAVTRAIAQSDNLEIMTGHLTQLLVGTLEIKGCSIFALEPESGKLNCCQVSVLSYRLPEQRQVFSGKSIGDIKKGKPVIIRDLDDTDLLQYPRRPEKRESAP